MATSTCMKCGGTRFELKLAEPSGARFKIYSVQCAKCGGVVGVEPYYHTASLLEKIAAHMGIDLHR